MVPPSPATLMRIPGVPPPPVAAPVIGARAVSVVERTVPARYSPLLVLTIIAIIPIIALLLLKLRLLEILLLELLLHHRLLLHLHLLLHEPVKHLILGLVSAHKLRIHHARHEVRCKRGNFGCHKRKVTEENLKPYRHIAGTVVGKEPVGGPDESFRAQIRSCGVAKE